MCLFNVFEFTIITAIHHWSVFNLISLIHTIYYRIGFSCWYSDKISIPCRFPSDWLFLPSPLWGNLLWPHLAAGCWGDWRTWMTAATYRWGKNGHIERRAWVSSREKKEPFRVACSTLSLLNPCPEQAWLDVSSVSVCWECPPKPTWNQLIIEKW